MPRPAGALWRRSRCSWPTRSRPQTLAPTTWSCCWHPHYLGNERVRADIATSHRALRPAGALFFQTHRRQGGETFARYTAERFGNVELLAIRGGHRLYRASRGPEPPASASDEAAPETVVLQETVRGLTISLETQAGVFSRRRFDTASRLLAETMQIGPADEVADLGCGAGLLGIVAAPPRTAGCGGAARQPRADCRTGETQPAPQRGGQRDRTTERRIAGG